ncbi:DUF1700 domain-containing protein [Andreprevotia chitinilytica]|uniref:DUF1700 domain-containing protein n=1 Tax=Andreprevotia chitinilytica TaxID=396808 RepID=UPI00069242BF|nr:DUF1700 domain-containing protein [Andreprevotia chitinilytica]
MNQQTYLQQLEHALAGLPRQDVEELLADCREYFREALADGRNEEDVAQGLGDPAQLARELRAKHRLKAWEQRKSFGSLWGVIAATAGLGVLNFVLAIPLLFYLGMLTTGFVVSTGILVAGLTLSVAWLTHSLFGWPADENLFLSRWHDSAVVRQLDNGGVSINISGDEGEKVVIGQTASGAAIHIESPEGSVHIEQDAGGGSLTLNDGNQSVKLKALIGEYGKKAMLIVGLILLAVGALGFALCLWLARLTVRLVARFLRYQLDLIRQERAGATGEKLAQV